MNEFKQFPQKYKVVDYGTVPDDNGSLIAVTDVAEALDFILEGDDYNILLENVMVLYKYLMKGYP